MASFDAGMASGYVFRLDVTEVAYDNAGNWSNVAWAVHIIKGAGSGKWADGPHYWSANIGGNVYSGSIGSYDFRNYGVLTLATGNTIIYHSPDGSFGLYSSAGWNDNDTWGELGDANTGGWLTLTHLRVPPNTPTGMTAVRVSDTSVNLSWSQTNASNGAPTSVLIQHRINGGAWADLVGLGPTTSATVATAANRKTEYRVRSGNAAGVTAFSAASAPVYTTPGAPSSAVAAKNAGLDINVTFLENVDYTEHEHEVWHGTVLAGVTTWDGAVLATLPSGTLSYLHLAPNPADVHVYRVRAKTGTLLSGYATTNSVQLLAPPNAPTVPAMGAFADKASALVFGWVHNPIDTSPQTAYEYSLSTNGGGAWTDSGKVVSTVDSVTVPASTYAANVALTMRVRTWGSATTGGAEGTGASAWSALRTVTFKTVPVATITSPADLSEFNDAVLRVTLGFSQAEAATFVKAELQLLEGPTVLETLESTILVGITMATPVQNGVTYTLIARVQDSHGIWSSVDVSTFDVVYLAPVAAGVVLSYLTDTGFGQIDLTIPEPGVGQAAATTLTITRTIDGSVETIVQDYPVEALMTFLDTTPVINGTNTYTVTTTSAIGAQTAATADLVTTECRRAYLSKGPAFGSVGVFGANLSVSESLSVASTTVEAAGRIKPIGLYGVETLVQLKVASFVYEPFGSTIDELRAILLVPGRACYRDSSGRRVFGTVKGSVQYKKVDRGDLSFTMTETA